MARHGRRRSRPETLVPGTLRVISVRMAASAPDARAAADVLADGGKGYVARYALGRDYHKVLRGRLAPAREAARGGNRRVRPSRLRRLGPGDGKAAGPQCRARLDRQAHQPDQRARGLALHAGRAVHRPAPAGRRSARRTAAAAAPPACRPARPARSRRRTSSMRGAAFPTSRSSTMARSRRRCARRSATASSAATTASSCAPGTSSRASPRSRIFACATASTSPTWSSCSRWDEAEYLEKTEGSALRRLGFRRWLRNIAVALGNAPPSARALAALRARAGSDDPVVREHVGWALARQDPSREPG